MSLGNQIREARKHHLAMTQRELANKLDIEPVNVSRWERGVAEPKAKYIRELALMTGLPVSWFFSENGEEAA